MILPPNSLHGFHNRGLSECCLLGISIAAHPAFFDGIAEADCETGFASMLPSEAVKEMAFLRRSLDVGAGPKCCKR